MSDVVKQPQDRKPKKDAPIKATVRGIEFEIPADAMDDYELLADLYDLQEGNGAKIVPLFRRLVGDRSGDALDAIRDDGGRVRVSAAAEFVQELLEAANPNS